jgi:hypothetical protein
MSKLSLLAAFGAGYVLGAKAGRHRYDQIVSAAHRVTEDPRVQSAASTVADTAKHQAPVVKEKVAAVAHAAADRTPFGSSHDGHKEEPLDRESTIDT